ncbi:MAG: hypothetical protein ACRESI_09305 [Gammaproteobacteria bacterium]
MLVVVLYRNDERLYAAVNAQAIDGGKDFGTEQSVSPKTLSASEKAARWLEVWFSNVSILTAGA